MVCTHSVQIQIAARARFCTKCRIDAPQEVKLPEIAQV